MRPRCISFSWLGGSVVVTQAGAVWDGPFLYQKSGPGSLQQGGREPLLCALKPVNSGSLDFPTAGSETMDHNRIPRAAGGERRHEAPVGVLLIIPQFRRSHYVRLNGDPGGIKWLNETSG